jgi:hypothetical protein
MHRRGDRILLRSRTSACALLLALLLSIAVLAPGIAQAAEQLKTGEGSSLSQLTEGGEEETNTTTTTASTGSSESSHNSSSTIVIVMGAAVVLLSGIGYVIVRDARGRQPATDPDIASGTAPRHSEAAMRKRRAKAKAARASRKRNR